MKPRDPLKYIRLRTTLVGVFIVVFLTVIGAQAVRLQVLEGEWLSRKAASQYEKSLTSRGRRGTIYDAKLNKLAVSIEVPSIGAFVGEIDDREKTAAALSRVLKIDRGALRERLAPGRTFVWVKRQVTPKEALAVRELDLPGITFLDERSRFYPYRTLAAQVLGFSGIDGDGLEGLEFYFDAQLRGRESEITVLRDALGREFDSEQDPMADYNGNNLILTIDRRIQFVTEDALEKAVTEFSAKSGLAVVMTPATGAILAMAHYPFFNPNAFETYDREVWRNRSITDPFEPGSTMKIFSAAAALEEGSFTANSIFYCENGAYRIGRNTIHDTKKHGWLTLQQIVQYSSNIGAVKVGEVIGPERLYNTLRDFGFGTKTVVDCPGESAGSLAPFHRWTRIDAGAIAFGQGVSASALQLVAATAAIANDGVLMKPYLVQAITDPNGRLLQSFGPKVVRRAVSAQTARTVARMMQTVVSEGGTGTHAALEGYSAAGKTGTAQKIDETGAYAKNRYVSSFVGFAPVENPRVAILVLLDEPGKYHYGGTVAAPAFRKIAHDALDYLDVPPAVGTDRLAGTARERAST